MKSKEIGWWKTSFGPEEARAVRTAFSKEHVSQGPLTAAFEKKFAEALGVPYAVATTSGSVALLMALMALEVGPGDEALLPNRTFVATAHAALLLGAKVVLADVRPDLPSMDVSRVLEKVTPRTKVVMPVHLCGRAVDMEALGRAAKERGFAVVEDACQALFSRNAAGYLGAQSEAGCFSLGVTKLISTGQGGVVVTRDRKIYERLKLIRNHGVPDTFEASYPRLGFNFKFTDLQASIGLVQLGRVKARLAHVKALYAKYAAALAAFDPSFLRLIPVRVAGGEVPLYIEVLCAEGERDRLRAFLQSRGIQSRPFLPDLHLSPHLGNAGEFPHSRPFGERGMFLPAGPGQKLANVDRVAEALKLYEKQRGRP